MTMANYSGAILNNIQYYIQLNDAYRTIEVRVLLAKVNWSIANCKISAVQPVESFERGVVRGEARRAYGVVSYGAIEKQKMAVVASKNQDNYFA